MLDCTSRIRFSTAAEAKVRVLPPFFVDPRTNLGLSGSVLRSADVLLTFANSAFFLALVGWLCYNMRSTGASQQRLLFAKEVGGSMPGEEVDAILSKGDEFHIFISHAWLTGQDIARVVKQRVKEACEWEVFLDVDECALHTPPTRSASRCESRVY
jgi:hypothetical protein